MMDEEQSLIVLQQIVNGYPSYIAKVVGSFVTKQTHLIKVFLTPARGDFSSCSTNMVYT